MISFAQATEMFQFACCPPRSLCIQLRVSGHHSRRVAPFGSSRLIACMQLPVNVSPVSASFFGLTRPGILPGPVLACVSSDGDNLLPSRSSTLTWVRDTRSPLFLFFLPSIVLLLLLSAKLKLTLSSVVQVHVVEQLRPLNNCEVESPQNTRAALPTALALCPSLCFFFPWVCSNKPRIDLGWPLRRAQRLTP